MHTSSPTFVVPVDFSTCSRAALARAKELAPTFGARLTLVHVLDENYYAFTPPGLPPLPPAYVSDLEERLRGHLDAEAAELRNAGVPCDVEVVRGHPVDALLDYLGRTKPALVVMGTHGRTGFAHALLGSVVERVVRRAGRPVLVVPDPERAPARLETGRRSSERVQQ
jgi:universal stress protein A